MIRIKTIRCPRCEKESPSSDWIEPIKQELGEELFFFIHKSYDGKEHCKPGIEYPCPHCVRKTDGLYLDNYHHLRRIDDLGRVQIPKAMQEKLGVTTGDEVVIQYVSDTLMISKL